MLDREFLVSTIENLKAQAMQVQGALEITAAFLKKFDEEDGERDAMTLDELQEAIERGAQNDSDS